MAHYQNGFKRFVVLDYSNAVSLATKIDVDGIAPSFAFCKYRPDRPNVT